MITPSVMPYKRSVGEAARVAVCRVAIAISLALFQEVPRQTLQIAPDRVRRVLPVKLHAYLVGASVRPPEASVMIGTR